LLNYCEVKSLASINVSALDNLFKSQELNIRTSHPLILRLDGVGFRRRLTDFKFPRDLRVHNALLNAAKEVMALFNFTAAYVVSDEINFIVLRNIPYGGRVEKLDSVVAGLTSSLVTSELGKVLFFDCRVIKLKDLRHALPYIMYRARVGLNNYVNSLLNMLTQQRSELHLLEAIERLRRLGININEIPRWEYLGSSIMWCRIVKKAVNPLTNESVEVVRRVAKVCDGYKELLKYISELVVT